ncbi:MAG: 5'/3'-nucleotidase SurE [Anaerolineae bacterium]|nr:5'/3'-nucleotidase SurE [Anaerolineae bacterium]
MKQPLILVTNDDGIDSRGLWAAVEAVLLLGEVLVVAPDRQWSGGGRSMPPDVSGRLTPASRRVGGVQVTAYAVDASPALAVIHGVVELAPRFPSLVVSGVNSGANLGIEVTISGTVGAALEGGAFGIPSIAVSLEMDPAYHLTGSDAVDYAAAIEFTQCFACQMLTNQLPDDVDALSVNVPADAAPGSPWRLTRLSRRRYFVPLPPDRANGRGRPGYKLMEDIAAAEPDSDVWAIKVDRVVSVTPLSLDLTARVSTRSVDRHLRVGTASCLAGLSPFLMAPLPADRYTLTEIGR